MKNSTPLNRELAIGKQKLSEKFRSSPLHTRKAGEFLHHNLIYYLRTGWACQYRDLANGRRAIVDVFVPGDVIGLDIVLRTRPLEGIVTLTAVTIEAIASEDAMMDLMAHRSTALYVAWQLAQRRRRADRVLAAILTLDAPGRLSMMVLDFYTRLQRRRLIQGPTYNLPLTQIQIGYYLGLTVVHVSRVLRSLREAGIVNLEKHSVTILDLERLMSLAQNGMVSSSSASIGARSFTEVALPMGKAAL